MKFMYWFAYYDLESPSVRYRALYPLETFQKQYGMRYRLVGPGYRPAQVFAFLTAWLSALLFRRKDSLIVIQRVGSNFIYANMLKLLVRIRRKNTVYDLDDADYLREDPSTIYYFARHCEKIAAGSREITRHLSEYNPRVFHVTSPVFDLGMVKKERSQPFTVGWVGGFHWGHKGSLERLVFPALRELKVPIRLSLLGVVKAEDREWVKAYFQDCPHLELDMPAGLNWSDEKGLQERISAFDVGIATLSPTPYQISKSGIKAKQYLNNGIPVLCNPLPENQNVVQHGINGFYCDSPAAFRQRIEELFYMEEEDYRALSAGARASVPGFDHAHYYLDWLHLASGQARQDPTSESAQSHRSWAAFHHPMGESIHSER